MTAVILLAHSINLDMFVEILEEEADHAVLLRFDALDHRLSGIGRL